MADENKPGQPKVESRQAREDQKAESGTVRCELLSTNWVEHKSEGGFLRHRRGDIVDVPKAVYDKLGDESDHFKPSFRKVNEDA